MATVALDKVTKRYASGDEPACREVSFSVAEGEFMVLLGPSGCGKTTVLRMIAGLEPLSSGTVSIDGRVMNEVPAKDRDIAMVFQSYALYPHMHVYENLAFGLRRRGIEPSETNRRVRAVAAKLGLGTMLQRKPYELSGGQRQRVALGRAMVREPKVFLFDEPLSNLDAALRVTTRNELIRQQKELGTTTIYVTHDQVEAMTMGHRICIMNRGEVVQIGAPLEVYRRPADTFVARFLGNPQMNLLSGKLEASSDCAVLRVSSSTIHLPGRLSPALASYVGHSVMIGIRPEDLYESEPPALGGRAARLPVRVIAVEPLGAETLLMLSLDGSNEELVARIGRDTALRSGDQTTVVLDTAALHFFDPESTRAIAWA